MSGVVGISEAASIGLHTMLVLASAPERVHRSREVAERLRVSGAHLSKVFQRLHRAGLVESVRGPKGGYRLSRPAEEISLLTIYEVIEGPLEEQGCLLEKPICDGTCCLLGGVLQRVSAEIRQKLAETTLAQTAAVLATDQPTETGQPATA